MRGLLDTLLRAQGEILRRWPGTRCAQPVGDGYTPCNRQPTDHGPAHHGCECTHAAFVHPDGGPCQSCYPRCAGFALDLAGLDHEWRAMDPDLASLYAGAPAL